MKQITIQDLLPLLRPGWVAMDADNTWWWYDVKPNANAEEPFLQWYGVGRDAVSLSDLFDIEPFEWHWTDSLMKCGNHIADASKRCEKMWRKEMNEVSKKSVNGGSQISGGFIFDQMDRFAHDYLKKEQNIKGYLFTECAHIHYNKQICDFGNVKIVPYETYYVGSAIVATVKVVDKKGKKEYATGMFFFVEKDHAYCDTKGE